MKKFKTMLAMMLALVCMTVAFTSCGGDDDDDNTVAAAAEQVAGTYVGETMSVALQGQGDQDPLENATFTVKKVDDNHVDVVLPAFGSAPMALPSITVKNCLLTGSNGKYTIAATSFDQTLENGKAVAETAFQATFENGKMKVDFTLKYGKMPFKMICSSETTKK